MIYLKYCISLFFASILVSCATTHVRVAENIAAKIENSKNILILKPEINTQVKYISLPQYFENDEMRQSVENQVIKGYKEELSKISCDAYEEKDIFQSRLYKEYSLEVKEELKKTANKVIADDLEYNTYQVAEKKLQKLPIHVPEEWKEYDAVIWLYGDAKMETNKEFCSRWRWNIIYNILVLPVSITSLLFPFIIPIAFIGSGEYSFNKSPDTTFLNMIILDPHSRKIIYQYDYFIQEWGFGEEEFKEIAKKTLEYLPSKN